MFNPDTPPTPASTAAKMKFMYDPSSMLLPHERLAKEQATLEKQKVLGTKKLPTEQSIPAQTQPVDHELQTLSTSPPEVQPPPYSEYQNSPIAHGQPAQALVMPNGSDSSSTAQSTSHTDTGAQPILASSSAHASSSTARTDYQVLEGVDPLEDPSQGPSRTYADEAELERIRESELALEEDASESPALLSDWEVVETLGTGTFGRVLLVRLRPPYRSASYHPIFPNIPYTPTDPTEPIPEQTAYADSQLPHYAMKVLAKTEIVRLKQVEHINSERAILERVRHPFLVELYGTYQDHLNVYMLLSYVPGGELFSHLRRAGRFTADVTRFYIASIILAIDYLHERDIIYRDLKPENLLLDRDGYLRIADFGFAKIVEDRTFTLCGTPEYLAPEIVLSKGHGKAVDWWALGILAFEMLAGYPPFFDDHPMGIYEKILANKIAFPSHIDPYAKDLIRRLLTADRSKRLGNLRGGARDVMSHRWFTGVDWATLERREIGAPIIPHVASLGDSQNFQRYPPPAPSELPGILGIPQGAADDPYKSLFNDFVFPPAAS